MIYVNRTNFLLKIQNRTNNMICLLFCFSSRRFVSGDEQAETLFDDLVKYATTSIDHRTALGGNAPVSMIKMSNQ